MVSLNLYRTLHSQFFILLQLNLIMLIIKTILMSLEILMKSKINLVQSLLCFLVQ